MSPSSSLSLRPGSRPCRAALRLPSAALVLLGLAGASPTAQAHPLDPLTEQELSAAVKAVRADPRFAPSTAAPAARFAGLALEEPPKSAVLAAQHGGPSPTRRALAIMFETRQNRVTEVAIELTARAGAAPLARLAEARVIPDVQPPILLGEYDQVETLVRADPRWQTAMAKRGLSVPGELYIDGWAPGLLSAGERLSGHRFMRALTFWKAKQRNPYGHPVEGVLATVDVTEGKVTDVVDAGASPINHADEDFVPPPAGGGLRPLHSTMPRGASFSIEGSQIRWQGFSFRHAMHPHKGLVLYDVGFEEERGRKRSVLYKATLSEMVVPYSDPDPNWAFRNAFDVGEYGVGRTAHSLERGLDVPEHAAFFDAIFADDDGGVIRVPRAVAVYERDGGVLWKHVEQGKRSGIGQRARELVLTFTTTIGNYDYGIDWVFHQDGVIDVQVYLTGVLLSKGTTLTTNSCDRACRRLVAPELLAPSHQHFFNFRVDLDVDGAGDNALVESNVRALPAGPENPSGNGFDAELTLLGSEQAARRDLDGKTARCWKVMSKTAKNRFGHPTGYTLKPGGTAQTYLSPSSPIRQRAAFVDHPLWATRYHDGEQSAAGEYPNQSHGGDGLPSFQRDDEVLDGGDVVLWYTFGITHVPRPEEWPIMNAHRVGFSLEPMNFFSRNPALTPR